LDERINTIEKLKSKGNIRSPSQYFGVLLISSQIPINKMNEHVAKFYELDPENNRYDRLLIQEKDWADKYYNDVYQKSIIVCLTTLLSKKNYIVAISNF
jgi:hypothetical protein